MLPDLCALKEALQAPFGSQSCLLRSVGYVVPPSKWHLREGAKEASWMLLEKSRDFIFLCVAFDS